MSRKKEEPSKAENVGHTQHDHPIRLVDVDIVSYIKNVLHGISIWYFHKVLIPSEILISRSKECGSEVRENLLTIFLKIGRLSISKKVNGQR